MSNVEDNPVLYKSLECPVVEGHRLIQHLAPRTADVGGIQISRLIGAWCFLDRAGPAVFSIDNQGLRVGPHPHTSLQTFTRTGRQYTASRQPWQLCTHFIAITPARAMPMIPRPTGTLS